MAWLIKYSWNVLVRCCAALALTESNVFNSQLSAVARIRLTSNWEQRWNAKLRLLWSCGYLLIDQELS